MELAHELEELIVREITALGYELVKIEPFFSGRRKVLRIFIDRPDGGVRIEDCVRVTKALGLVLDGVETMPGPYNLEISSPGIARPLTRPEHFERFRGERARVEYLDDAGAKVTAVGNIAGASAATIILSVDGSERSIAFGKILKANLRPDEWGAAKPACPKKERRLKRPGE